MLYWDTSQEQGVSQDTAMLQDTAVLQEEEVTQSPDGASDKGNVAERTVVLKASDDIWSCDHGALVRLATSDRYCIVRVPPTGVGHVISFPLGQRYANLDYSS